MTQSSRDGSRPAFGRPAPDFSRDGKFKAGKFQPPCFPKFKPAQPPFARFKLWPISRGLNLIPIGILKKVCSTLVREYPC